MSAAPERARAAPLAPRGREAEIAPSASPRKLGRRWRFFGGGINPAKADRGFSLRSFLTLQNARGGACVLVRLSHKSGDGIGVRSLCVFFKRKGGRGGAGGGPATRPSRKKTRLFLPPPSSQPLDLAHAVLVHHLDHVLARRHRQPQPHLRDRLLHHAHGRLQRQVGPPEPVEQ